MHAAREKCNPAVLSEKVYFVNNMNYFLESFVKEVDKQDIAYENKYSRQLVVA